MVWDDIVGIAFCILHSMLQSYVLWVVFYSKAKGAIVTLANDTWPGWTSFGNQVVVLDHELCSKSPQRLKSYSIPAIDTNVDAGPS